MCWCENVIQGCKVPLLLAAREVPQLQMGANNNKGGEFVKKADNPVVAVNGDNNNVEVTVNITETSSKTPVAVAIALGAVAIAAVLAVSLCCPELLADFVCWLIGVVIGS